MDRMPSFEAMLKPTLTALHSLGGKAAVPQIDATVQELMNVPAELAAKHGEKGKPEFASRMAWARSYLKKYGLIQNTKRGEWSFTEGFSGTATEIDAIDTAALVKSVRDSSLGAFNNPDISTVESGIAFGRYATAVLADFLGKQGKSIERDVMMQSGLVWDMFLPDGLLGPQDNRPTYVEIKYYPSGENSYKRCIERLNTEPAIPAYARVLFVFGSALSVPAKEDLEARARLYTKAVIEIWGPEDLERVANPESDYINYWMSPKEALVDAAIQDKATPAQKDTQRENTLEMLKRAYLNENMTLFLGAGVSIDAGIPLWETLVNQLLGQMVNDRTAGRKLTAADLDNINRFARENQENSPLTQVRYIKEGLPKGEFTRYVHRALYPRGVKSKTGLLDAILQFCAPRGKPLRVRGVVSYNFDDLLEDVLKKNKVDYNVVHREADITDGDCLNIYHVHGYLPKKREGANPREEVELVFSEEDYHRIYRDAYCWSNLVQLNAFRDSSCLFIGCSLTDPNLRRLLDVAARQDEKPRHFAILKRKRYNADGLKQREKDSLALYQNIDDNIRQGFFQSLGLNIIWVDEFAEIPGILLGLGNK